MESIIVATEDFLTREEIKYEPTELAGLFKISLIGKNGFFHGYVEADEERRSIVVVTLAPVRCSRSKRREVAELIARIHYRLLLGSFNLSMNNGTISFKTSIVLGRSDLQDEVMRHLLTANWSTMDTYLPVISAVLFAGLSPREAISMKRRRKPRPDTPHQGKPDQSFQQRFRDILGGSEN